MYQLSSVSLRFAPPQLSALRTVPVTVMQFMLFRLNNLFRRFVFSQLKVQRGGEADEHPF
jgi:hypothetical protein